MSKDYKPFDGSSYTLIEVKYYLSCQLIYGSNSNKYSLSKLDVDKNDFGVTMCYIDSFKLLVTNYKTKNHHTHLLNVSYFSVYILSVKSFAYRRNFRYDELSKAITRPITNPKI